MSLVVNIAANPQSVNSASISRIVRYAVGIVLVCAVGVICGLESFGYGLVAELMYIPSIAVAFFILICLFFSEIHAFRQQHLTQHRQQEYFFVPERRPQIGLQTQANMNGSHGRHEPRDLRARYPYDRASRDLRHGSMQSPQLSNRVTFGV